MGSQCEWKPTRQQCEWMIAGLLFAKRAERDGWVRLAVTGRSKAAASLWCRHFSQEAVARQIGIDVNRVKRSPAWKEWRRRIIHGQVEPDHPPQSPWEPADLSAFGIEEGVKNAA